MKEKVEYFIVSVFIKAVKVLPESFTYKMLSFFGLAFFWLFKKRRELAIKNLSFAFKDKTQNEINQLAKRNFLSIARTIAEVTLVLSNKKSMTDFIGNENNTLDGYMEASKHKSEKQGMIFITAHFGNWEILANYFAKKGFPMTVIGRRGNNKLIEQNIITPFRQKYGNVNIHKSEAMNSMVKTLKNGGRIGILIDQKAGRTNSVITTFFGKKCSTTISIAAMKLKYNPLVIPAFSFRNEKGKLELLFLQPIEYVADEFENKEDKIKAMTQKYNDILEEMVTKYPEQWFWMHNRWKI